MENAFCSLLNENNAVVHSQETFLEVIPIFKLAHKLSEDLFSVLINFFLNNHTRHGQILLEESMQSCVHFGRPSNHSAPEARDSDSEPELHLVSGANFLRLDRELSPKSLQARQKPDQIAVEFYACLALPRRQVKIYGYDAALSEVVPMTEVVLGLLDVKLFVDAFLYLDLMCAHHLLDQVARQALSVGIPVSRCKVRLEGRRARPVCAALAVRHLSFGVDSVL